MWRHLLLFVLCSATAFGAGIIMAGGQPLELASWQDGSIMGGAASYAASLMAILTAHEMGHYLYCRRHGVDASLPYFLPGLGPIPPWGGAFVPFIGTFGAVIRMELRPMSSRALLEIGAWGPLAGFVLCVPVLLIGFSLSHVAPLPEDPMLLGDSLLLLGSEALFFPDIPPGHDVFLHPMAMAGWAGMLLTALNLLPLSQLDGGHIAYSVFGPSYNRLAWPLFAGLLAMGLFVFPGWLVFAALVGVIGPRHPDIVSDAPVTGRPRWLAVASLIIFALCFTPRPIIAPSAFDMALEAFTTAEEEEGG